VPRRVGRLVVCGGVHGRRALGQLGDVLREVGGVLEGVVAEDHDAKADLLALGDDPAALEDEPGAGPGPQALGAEELVGAGVGQLVVELHDLVDERLVVERADGELALVAQAGHVVALGGLHGHDLDVGVLALEELREPGDRAAGAKAREHVRDLSLGLRPDLRAGGLHVGPDVGLVLVLVGHGVALRLGAGVGLGEVDRALAHAGAGAERVVDDIELGAGELEHELLLEGHLVGADGLHGVAPDAAEPGEAQAGVAAGGLDDALAEVVFAVGPARAEALLLLHLADEVARGAVLDRSEGVHPLELGEQREVLRGVHAVDAHERRRVLLVGEHLENVVIHAGLVVHLALRVGPSRLEGSG
jgi:hypothetical protein